MTKLKLKAFIKECMMEELQELYEQLPKRNPNLFELLYKMFDPEFAADHMDMICYNLDRLCEKLDDSYMHEDACFNDGIDIIIKLLEAKKDKEE